MPRSRRVSRPLIAVLALLIVVASLLYLRHARSVRATALRQKPSSTSPDPRLASGVRGADKLMAMDSTTASVLPAALVTQTPSANQPLPTETSRVSNSGTTSPPAPASTTRPVSLSATSGGSNSGSSTDSSVASAPPKPPVGVLSSNPLADARSKKDSGDLLAAREILNSALASGTLSKADGDAVRAMCGELNKTLIFSPRRFADDSFEMAYPVQSGERLGSIAARNGLSWELLARVNGIEPRRLRSGTTIKVIKGPFYAVVTKSLFRLDVYLGAPDSASSMFVESVPVGLGKDGSTPTGTWLVEPGNKIRHPKYYSPRGDGVLDAEDPKNPLAGYWLGLVGLDGQAIGKTSYGVHGTIDPNSIGKQESMGCIRLRSEDIALLFDLLVEGKSKVIVRD